MPLPHKHPTPSAARLQHATYNSQSHHGFTLIELLVVIAIIAILAALLLPTLYRAKVAADSTVCKSNLHQLALGITTYAQDNGAYPDGQTWNKELAHFIRVPWPKDNYATTNTGQYGGLVPGSYLGPAQGVYVCPGYNRVRGVFWDNAGIAGSAGSYAYNSYGWMDAWDDVRPPPLQMELFSQGLGGILVSNPTYNTRPYKATPENRVTCPSDMIAVGDAPFGPRVAGLPQWDLVGGSIAYSKAFELYPTFYSEVILGQPADDLNVRMMPRRHGGRWNMAFCDGHVENLKPKALFDFRNPDVARRWNSDHLPHNEQWYYP